ncbi:coproporphyrinogen III oxidase [Rhodosalinus halophilus]|uniref:Heme chaperone HemW n=1 Tax=Rhodosalinus halophilus TaxID=2259333 RepID=A0A365U7H5_9RHOB|nr:radical SAM family heme chaperone HemW [Rhodosalinus halophilus]RBI84676.1 coproporphyrinogen III oxidase [Rhodosalinus halophilus]
MTEAAAAPPAEDWRAGGFGLYLHWPFCAAKCPYCDFNSHVSRSVDQRRWQAAFLSEIDRVGRLSGGRVLNSVFFGGGTPSLMDPDLVAAVLDRVRATWPLANDIEITLEANPTSVEAERFRGYAEAGINRVSLGIQALNDADLARLGRLHSAAEARRAFDVGRAHFDRVSFDLIYARQFQSLDAWRAELSEALAMAVDHLSLYQLTIEPGTAFGDRFAVGRLAGLPDEDLGADMYDTTQELCAAAGYAAYEVSNHALPGAESRHNLVYWRYGDYAGIGPGAHGRLTQGGTRIATEAVRLPEAWLSAVERGATCESRTPIPAREQAGEYLMMGLRISDGIDLGRYSALAGAPPDPARVAALSQAGLVETDGKFLRATPDGRLLLNRIVAELLPD